MRLAFPSALVLLLALALAFALPGPAAAQASLAVAAGESPAVPSPSPPPGARQGGAGDGIDAGPVTNLKFSGLAQVWFQAGDQGYVDTFRLRRLRLYVSGNVTPRARFMVMLDPSRALTVNQERVVVDGTSVLKDSTVNQGTRILQDAYIAVRLGRRVEVQAGQFKLPMNLEGSLPVQELSVVERSLMTTDRPRGGLFGDLRDIGVMARGAFDNGIEFRAGVFNELGTSQNDVDRDNGKSLAGRLAYRVPGRGLQVGGFAAWEGPAATDVSHRRAGVDVVYERGRLRLHGELAGGRDGSFRRRGYFGTATWRVHPLVDVSARLDVFDPDTRRDSSRSDVRERDYIGAASYYLSGNNLKWQAQYLRKTFRDAIVPSQHVLLSSLQVAW